MASQDREMSGQVRKKKIDLVSGLCKEISAKKWFKKDSRPSLVCIVNLCRRQW